MNQPAPSSDSATHRGVWPVAVIVVAALAATGVIGWWVTGDPTGDLELREPKQVATQARAASGPPIGILTNGTGVAGEAAGAWVQFRGADRTNVVTSPLARAWGDDGPIVLWERTLGEGYAAPAVLGGRVYLVDYDREEQADVIRCLSLDTGEEIWRYAYSVSLKRNRGMSRTVPAVTEKYVVALGPKCHVLCLDAVTGERVWSMDLVSQFGTTVPDWYAGQCPLIDGERLILAPGGPGQMLVAVELATGEVVWRSPNPRGWVMSHTSITPMTIGGVAQYVYSGMKGAAGYSAADGSLLWETSAWSVPIAAVASPVDCGEGRILLSGGYKAGAKMIRVVADASGDFAVETLWETDHRTFGATQQTPIYFENHIYGIRPNGELVCLDLAGQVRWTSGAAYRFGLGPLVIADGVVLALSDGGRLVMAAAVPDRFEKLGEADVLDGHEAWGPIAVAGGRVLVRDFTMLRCLDLSE